MDSLWESNLLIQFAAVFIFAIYKIAINSASPFVRVVLFFVRAPRVVFFFVRDFELCFFSPEILSCASLRKGVDIWSRLSKSAYKVSITA